MKYEELNREEARNDFLRLRDNNGPSIEYFDTLSVEYQVIRKEILDLVPKPIAKTYEFDLLFGIKLYEYFRNTKFEDFNEAIASNYDYWRFLCIRVVPDLIIQRHGFVETYFYEKNVRIYLSTLWWFIEMGYQGDLDSTYDCLKRFSTDYILQFVERPGRDGIYIEIVRCIFKYLNQLPLDVINEKKGKQILIRRLLIQHTAKNVNFNLVVEGKTEEYVKGLFHSCGVKEI